jgi:hypothetical protein
MLNKSNRNKVKIRSTKKKYKQRTRKINKYGGQGEIEIEKRKKEKGKGTHTFISDYPDVQITEIAGNIGFEIPETPKFNSKKDNYKFLEMADRDLTVDMETKLNKLEFNGGIASQFCKYMYLIRAQHPDTKNTVLHYICNRKSVEMFHTVFPYFLILYNKQFPQLLEYYINRMNKYDETPLDLLKKIENNNFTSSMDYSEKFVSAVGLLKNTVTNISDPTKSAIRIGKKIVNLRGAAKTIGDILIKFGAKNGNSVISPNRDKNETPEEVLNPELSNIVTTVRSTSNPDNRDASPTIRREIADLDESNRGPTNTPTTERLAITNGDNEEVIGRRADPTFQIERGSKRLKKRQRSRKKVK